MRGKKEAGFIRSQSSNGLKKPKAFYQSDSQSFSLFQKHDQKKSKRQNNDGEFSPYKQPSVQATQKNNIAMYCENDNIRKNIEINKIKYPPKSYYPNSDKKTKQPCYKKDFTQQFKNNKRFENKIRSAQKTNKLNTLSQEHYKPQYLFKKQQQENRMTLNNQKLKLQWNYNTFHPNNTYKENNQKILQQVNKMCQKISQIKLDFQFNQSGNFIKKNNNCDLPLNINNNNQSQNKTERAFRMRRQEKQVQIQFQKEIFLNNQHQKKLNLYKQFDFEKQQNKLVIYQNNQDLQFSLGGYSNKKQKQIYPINVQSQRKKSKDLQYKIKHVEQIEKIQDLEVSEKENPSENLKTVHNKLIINNMISSLDDQSSITQCREYNQKQFLKKNKNSNQGKFYNPKHKKDNINQVVNCPKSSQRSSIDFKSKGVQRTTSQYFKNNILDFLKSQSDDSLERELIQQYKTSQFKNKDIRQQFIQDYRRKKLYSDSIFKSNSKRNFRQQNQLIKQKINQKQQQGFFLSKGGICFGIDTRQFKGNQDQNNYNESNHDRYYLKNKNSYNSTNPVIKKSKKVNLKQQILKRRQLAKNYDQMARKKVFRS